VTEEPRRLLDDDGTSAVLRRDLANARAADLDYDVDAAVARFEAGLANTPTPATEAAAGVKSGATWWIVGGGAVAAAALAWSVGRDSTPARVEPVSPAVVQSPAIEPPRAIEPTAPPPAIAPPTEAPKAIVPPAPTQPRKPRATAASSAASPPDDDDTLAREMAATAAAKRALASDPARALELVAAASREFGKSVYAEDREGIAVLALARLGREAEALARGKAYLTAHPKGSYADRIRDVLGADAEKP
jgi:hypothetical protein